MDGNPTREDGVTDEPGALGALRAAAAGIEALDGPENGAAFDPAEHAARVEAVHDALVAVLAEIDTGAGAAAERT